MHWLEIFIHLERIGSEFTTLGENDLSFAINDILDKVWERLDEQDRHYLWDDRGMIKNSASLDHVPLPKHIDMIWGSVHQHNVKRSEFISEHFPAELSIAEKDINQEIMKSLTKLLGPKISAQEWPPKMRSMSKKPVMADVRLTIKDGMGYIIRQPITPDYSLTGFGELELTSFLKALEQKKVIETPNDLENVRVFDYSGEP